MSSINRGTKKGKLLICGISYIIINLRDLMTGIIQCDKSCVVPDKNETLNVFGRIYETTMKNDGYINKWFNSVFDLSENTPDTFFEKYCRFTLWGLQYYKMFESPNELRFNAIDRRKRYYVKWVYKYRESLLNHFTRSRDKLKWLTGLKYVGENNITALAWSMGIDCVDSASRDMYIMADKLGWEDANQLCIFLHENFNPCLELYKINLLFLDDYFQHKTSWKMYNVGDNCRLMYSQQQEKERVEKIWSRINGDRT